MRWPWKRPGVTDAEAHESRRHLAEVRAREVTVDSAMQRKRATKTRNGFGPLIEEGLNGGRR